MSDISREEEVSEVRTPADVPQLAAMLKALGAPTRLSIFQFLRGCCCPVAVDEETGDVRPVMGPTVGEVCCHITGRDRVTSTISEHLKDLRTAGLILMERRGKSVICAVNPAALAALGAFFGGGAGEVVALAGCAAADDTSGDCGGCCVSD